MKADCTIQEAAARTGVSVHTLRYYERVGLLDGIARAPSGHRRFTADDLVWVELLVCLRKTGMTIRDMQRFAELGRRGDETVAERRDLLLRQRSLVLAQRQQLDRFLAVLDLKIGAYRAADEERRRADREAVPARPRETPG